MLTKKGNHPYQRSYCASEHITTLVTIRADGKIMPPLIIYKSTFPKTAYRDIGPEDAMYKTSASAYINTDMYLEYIKYIDSMIPGGYFNLLIYWI